MIKEVEGNLLDMFDNDEFDIIIHGCNCLCNFGAGIARQIKERYPEAYEADLKTKKGDRSKMGSFAYAVLPPGKIIVNLYSQFDYGGGVKVSYSAVDRGLEALRDMLFQEGMQGLRIGFPKLGAGLAGGNWDVLSESFERILGDLDATLVIYNG